jgi:hypothetical protein
VLKNALVFVKSAKRAREKMCVFLEFSLKDAKRLKLANFFARCSLGEAAARRIVEMGNRREGETQGCGRALRLTRE